MHQREGYDFARHGQGQPGPAREVPPSQHWLTMRANMPWRPPTDVFETDACLVVKVEIAGMGEEDFSISLQGRDLVVSGHRHDPADKLAYQQMEIHYGDFETSVHLPWSVDASSVEATYEQGFLNIVLPRAKTKRVPVSHSAKAGTDF